MRLSEIQLQYLREKLEVEQLLQPMPLPAGEAIRKRPVSFAGTVQLELEEAA
jgi:hypothetical protein